MGLCGFLLVGVAFSRSEGMLFRCDERNASRYWLEGPFDSQPWLKRLMKALDHIHRSQKLGQANEPTLASTKLSQSAKKIGATASPSPPSVTCQVQPSFKGEMFTCPSQPVGFLREFNPVERVTRHTDTNYGNPLTKQHVPLDRPVEPSNHD